MQTLHSIFTHHSSLEVFNPPYIRNSIEAFTLSWKMAKWYKTAKSKEKVKILANCMFVPSWNISKFLPHHSEQMSERSQVSRIALRRGSQNVFVFVIVFVFVFVNLFLVMSCLLITLNKCLKGHKSLGWLLGRVLKMSLSFSLSLSLSLYLSLYLSLSLYFCWSGHGCSSLGSDVSKVTSL